MQNIPPVVIPTGVKFNQQMPPSMLESHRYAAGLHCRNRSIVVDTHRIDVAIMQNHNNILCHLRMTIRRRNSATEAFDAAIPMMQIPCPMTSHIMAFE